MTPAGFGDFVLKTVARQFAMFGLQNLGSPGGTWHHWRACVKEKCLHEVIIVVRCFELKIESPSLVLNN